MTQGGKAGRTGRGSPRRCRFPWMPTTISLLLLLLPPRPTPFHKTCGGLRPPPGMPVDVPRWPRERRVDCPARARVPEREEGKGGERRRRNRPRLLPSHPSYTSFMGVCCRSGSRNYRPWIHVRRRCPLHLHWARRMHTRFPRRLVPPLSHRRTPPQPRRRRRRRRRKEKQFTRKKKKKKNTFAAPLLAPLHPRSPPNTKVVTRAIAHAVTVRHPRHYGKRCESTFWTGRTGVRHRCGSRCCCPKRTIRWGKRYPWWYPKAILPHRWKGACGARERMRKGNGATGVIAARDRRMGVPLTTHCNFCRFSARRVHHGRIETMGQKETPLSPQWWI